MRADDDLQRLLDVRAIEELLYRAADRLDANDGKGLSELYVEDGVNATRSGEVIGRAAIAARADHEHSGDCAATSHHTSNILPIIDGDRASCTSYLIAVHRYVGHEHELLQTFGRWLDDLVRVDGQWYFVRREVRVVMSQGHYPRLPSAHAFDEHPGHIDRSSV